MGKQKKYESSSFDAFARSMGSREDRQARQNQLMAANRNNNPAPTAPTSRDVVDPNGLSPDYKKGFMDCFNKIDQMLDGIMDTGTLEQAMAMYKRLKQQGILQGNGNFQTLIDIMNGNFSGNGGNSGNGPAGYLEGRKFAKRWNALREDFIDDIDYKNLRNAGPSKLGMGRISKDMRSYSSKEKAHKLAKDLKDKGLDGSISEFGKDFSAYVRNIFTRTLKFENSENYRQVTIEMRRAAGVSDSYDIEKDIKGNETESETFTDKTAKRMAARDNPTDDILDIDAITISELAVILAVRSLYEREDWRELSDENKLEFCRTCASYISHKYDRVPADEIGGRLSGDFIDAIRDEFGLEIVVDPAEVLTQDPFTLSANPNFEAEMDAAYNLSRDEIRADTAARRAARAKSKERRSARDAEEARVRQAIYDKNIKYFNKLLDKEGWTEIYRDVAADWAEYMCVQAGYDYSNVDHEAEEAAYADAHAARIEKYGQEAWDAAVADAGDMSGRDLSGIGGDYSGMSDKKSKAYDAANAKYAAAKEKYGYLNHESRRR